MWLGYLEEYPDYWTQGETEEELNKNIDKAFSELKIESSKGNNLVIKGKRGNRE